MILPNFLLVKSLKVLLIFVFALMISGCFMHYTNEIPPNQIHDGKDNNLSRIQLPIKLKLDRSNVPKSITVVRSGQIEKDHSLISHVNLKYYLENYYSQEILSNFKMGELFTSNPNSNVIIVIKSTPNKLEVSTNNIFYDFVSAFSFSVIPYKYNSYGDITFEIFDLGKNEKIKVYTYEISHSAYQGISMFLLSPFIPIFSDYIDHSTNERTFSIMRRAYEAFYRDLTYDLSRDPKLLESFYINDSPNYSV